MTLIVSDNARGDFEPIPVGVYPAVCYLVADLGIQPGGQYRPRHQVHIRWELPDLRVTWTDRDGNEHEGPRTIGQTFTASLSPKAKLRGVLEGWRGRAFTAQELQGFDLMNICGAACQLAIGNQTGADGRVYAQIAAVLQFAKGTLKPSLSRPLLRYSPDEPSQFSELPGWLQDKIRSAQVPVVDDIGPAFAGEEFDDDIPF